MMKIIENEVIDDNDVQTAMNALLQPLGLSVVKKPPDSSIREVYDANGQIAYGFQEQIAYGFYLRHKEFDSICVLHNPKLGLWQFVHSRESAKSLCNVLMQYDKISVPSNAFELVVMKNPIYGCSSFEELLVRKDMQVLA